MFLKIIKYILINIKQYLANIEAGGLHFLVYCKQNCLAGKFFLFINILLYN